MSQINNIVKVQISKFLGYKLPPVPEDESVEDIDKYKIYDFDFTKGKIPDGVEFYRLSRDWDWDGNEYDIDQPVLYGEGLWNWGERTNLNPNSEDMKYGSGVVFQNTDGVYAMLQATPITSTSSLKLSTIGLLPNTPFTLSFDIKKNQNIAYPPLHDGNSGLGFVAGAGTVDRIRYLLQESRFVFPGDTVYTDITQSREPLSDGWERVTLTLTAPDPIREVSWGWRENAPDIGEPYFWVKNIQIEQSSYASPFIPTDGSQVSVTKSSVFSSTVVRKDFTLFGFLVINGEENEDKYLFSMGREAYPERYIGLKLNRLTNKLQLDSSVGVSKESVKTYKAGDVIKFAVVRCRDRFGVVINGEEFLEINFKVNFLNSDLNKLFFGNYFDSDEHILPSYIKHFAIYDKPFNTNTLIHMTEVEDGDS